MQAELTFMKQVPLLGYMKTSLVFILLVGILGYTAAQTPNCRMACPCGYVEVLGCPICACSELP